jgi:hypothetical protein
MSTSSPVLSVAQAHRLKGATRALIAAAGGVDGVAATLAMSRSQVSNYQNVSEPSFMPIDKVAALEALDGVEAHVTMALAAMTGRAVVQLPTADDDVAWTKALGSLAKEIGEVMAGVGAALADDGQVSVAERDTLNILKDVNEAASRLATLRAMLLRSAEASLPPTLRRAVSP